MRLIALLRIT